MQDNAILLSNFRMDNLMKTVKTEPIDRGDGLSENSSVMDMCAENQIIIKTETDQIYIPTSEMPSRNSIGTTEFNNIPTVGHQITLKIKCEPEMQLTTDEQTSIYDNPDSSDVSTNPLFYHLPSISRGMCSL